MKKTFKSETNQTITNLYKFNTWNPKTVIDVNGEAVIKQESDMINHPKHYSWFTDKFGIEPITILREFNFNIGNAMKYLIRHGRKRAMNKSERESKVEDLKKAIVYINNEIDKFEKEN